MVTMVTVLLLAVHVPVDIGCLVVVRALALSNMAYEVLFTIWQGGQLAIPLKTTLAKVKTILGADYTLAMP